MARAWVQRRLFGPDTHFFERAPNPSRLFTHAQRPSGRPAAAGRTRRHCRTLRKPLLPGLRFYIFSFQYIAESTWYYLILNFFSLHCTSIFYTSDALIAVFPVAHIYLVILAFVLFPRSSVPTPNRLALHRQVLFFSLTQVLRPRETSLPRYTRHGDPLETAAGALPRLLDR